MAKTKTTNDKALAPTPQALPPLETPAAGTQLVPAVGPASVSELVIPESWGVTAPTGDFRSTIQPTTQERRHDLLAALEGEAVGAEVTINVPILATDITCHPAEKLQDGEMIRLLRVVVSRADGLPVEFFTAGILKSLDRICRLERPAPWNPPLKLMLLRIPCGGERSMYTYRVVT